MTPQTKHTPGPWHVRETYNGRTITKTLWIAPEGPEPGTEALARMMRHNHNRADDARLIAAAPELLEACRGAIAYLVSGDLTEAMALKRLREAIAKVEGNEPRKPTVDTWFGG